MPSEFEREEGGRDVNSLQQDDKHEDLYNISVHLLF
jgi:hypothetical protein